MTRRKSRKPQRRSSKASRKKFVTPEKEQEILGLLLLLFSALLFIALYTYNPTETPSHMNLDGAISNGLGWAGVYIAHFLMRWTIGYPVLIVPFIVFIWGWNRLLQKDPHLLKRWTGLALLFAFYISIAFALHESISAMDGPAPEFSFSGYMGMVGANVLIFFLGHYGAIVLLIGLILLMTRFPWWRRWELLPPIWLALKPLTS